MIINASGGNADAVMTVAQTLSDTQKIQARTNIGALSDTDGSVSTVYTGNLTVAGWSGNAAPYSQAVTITGILATDTPIVDLVPSTTYATAEPQIEGWANIYRAVAAANKITFYATDIPTVSLSFQARCIRK